MKVPRAERPAELSKNGDRRGDRGAANLKAIGAGVVVLAVAVLVGPKIGEGLTALVQSNRHSDVTPNPHPSQPPLLASAAPKPSAGSQTGGGETIASGSLYDRVRTYVDDATQRKQATVSFNGLPMDKLSGSRKDDRETQLVAAANSKLDKAKVAAACAVVTQVDPSTSHDTVAVLNSFFHDQPMEQDGGKIYPVGLGRQALNGCAHMVSQTPELLLPPVE